MEEYSDRTLQGLSGREGLSYRGHSDRNTQKKISVLDIMDDDSVDDETTIKEVPMRKASKRGLSTAGMIAGLVFAVIAVVFMSGNSPSSTNNTPSNSEGSSILDVEQDDRALKKKSKSCCSTDGVHCDITLDQKCHDKEKKCLKDGCGGIRFVEDERFCCSADGITCDTSLKKKCHKDVDDCLKCGRSLFIIDFSQQTKAEEKLEDKMDKLIREWEKDPDSKKTKAAIEKYQKEIEKQVKKGDVSPSDALDLLNKLNEFLSGPATTSLTSTTTLGFTTATGSTETETSTGTTGHGTSFTSTSDLGTSSASITEPGSTSFTSTSNLGTPSTSTAEPGSTSFTSTSNLGTPTTSTTEPGSTSSLTGTSNLGTPTTSTTEPGSTASLTGTSILGTPSTSTTEPGLTSSFTGTSNLGTPSTGTTEPGATSSFTSISGPGTSSTTTTSATTTSTIDAVELDRAPPGVVMTLTNDRGQPAGRSYDGRDWEPLHPLLMDFDCSGSNCQMVWPDSQGRYQIHQRKAPSISQEVETSRLLAQTTYGPTKSLIDSVKSMSPESWIASQMNEDPTFHREHIRKRMNSRLRQPMYHHGVRDACEAGSRWNRYAFNMLDFGKSLVTTSTASGSVLLTIDGIPRAELPDGVPFSVPEGNVLCDIDEYVGGTIFIGMDDTCDTMNATYLENPAINFRDSDALSTLLQPPADAFLEDLSPTVLDTKLLVSLKNDCIFLGAGPLFVKAWEMSDYSGAFEFYMEDKRIELTDNSLDSTSVHAVSVDSYCPNVPKTFLNQESCRIIPDCSAPMYSSAEIQLDDATLRQFYLMDGIYVYRINDLRLEESDDSPCDIDEEDGKVLYYRWIRKDSSTDDLECPGNQTDLDENITEALLGGLVEKLNTTSPDMLVIDVPNDLYSCSDPNKTSLGASLYVPGRGCWTHSHGDEWSIFDFSRWTMIHDGNNDAFLSNHRNPIAKHAEQGSTVLNYPDWKPMERWEDRKWIFKPLGIYGETVDYALLDSQIQAPKMASYIGSIQNGWSDPGLEVCGSPGEVANDPTSGNQYKTFFNGDQDNIPDHALDQDHGNQESKQMIWYTIALTANDQLRQRIAWALAQIFVVTENDVPKISEGELWANYFDIFVRHAFGDFRSLLKEVSLSPIMGEMLTFVGTRSLASNIEDGGGMIFPDENFAREIWQLFTIGLWKLHMDGTQILDDSGMPIETYNNKDIVSMARGWTGLDRETQRGNYESWNTHLWPQNTIDPMRFMTKDTRDPFPKLSIEDQGKRHYIGDGLQRCDSLPEKAFLKKGAVYRYLGSSGVSELNRADPHWWDDDLYVKRLVLSEADSHLFSALCNEGNGKCQFESQVELAEDLECDGSCSPSIWGGGNAPCECTIDEPRIVTLLASTKTGTHLPTHFEYVKPPCVRLAFPDGETVAVKERKEGYGAMCADAGLPEAATSCCQDDKLDNARPVCVFAGERMTFAKADEYCQLEGLNTCSWVSTKKSWECGNYDQGESWRHWKAGLHFSWTNSSCSVKAQINQDGEVAIIHDVSPLPNPVKGRVAVDTGTYFGVFWDADNSYPRASAGCGSCETRGTTCLCDADVTSEAVFTAGVPVLSDIMSQLHIGAPDPLSLEGYSQTSSGTGFLVHAKNSILDVDTIFEVLSNSGGPSTFLKNMKSTVSLDGNRFSFRNPPMMNSLVDSTRRDAMYELDAMLDMYATHSNVAPFISSKLISLLVTSNPSPAYVETVATAFRDGQYGTFGSGQYGDLGAAVAAIFLHPEARSVTLDSDPTHGSKREPVLQLMHYLRAMELGPKEERQVTLRDLREHLGQEPHNAPSVFNFFLAEFSPAGPVFDAGLVSPQSQALVAPIIMETINGYTSLPRFGLTNCADGLGDKRERHVIQDTHGSDFFDCNIIDDGVRDVPFNLQWMPDAWSTLPIPDPQAMNITEYKAFASAVVDEMDLLLTGGKLERSNQEVIVNAYVEKAATTSMQVQEAHMLGLQVAQQLFAVTPEFQITNRYFDEVDAANPTEREPVVIEEPDDPEPVTGYKAIVYLFLDGGADTFSLVVPKTGCTPADLPDQYYKTRGDVAINAADLLEIVDTSGSQPCSTFGLHPSLGDIQSLYNNEEAAVVAGIGPLIRPTTKLDFDSENSLPPALFAHNTQKGVTQTVIPQDSTANGVLGRIGDVINEQESMLQGNRTEIFDAYSISGTPPILAGAPGVSRVADVLTGSGVSELSYAGRKIESEIQELHKHHATSIFGETVSDSYASTFERVKVLKNAIDEIGLDPATETCFQNAPGWLWTQFRTVARVIKRRDVLQAKRDVFYTRLGGFDTHSDNGPKFTELMTETNAAIKCFVEEMKKQGVWQDITIVTASEFGRTMTSNGLGTDHAWSGNHLIMGGGIKGKQIFGKFPNDLTADGPLNIGRGRLIPEVSWDSLWNALGKWFGLTQDLIDGVLPNAQNFPNLLEETDLYK